MSENSLGLEGDRERRRVRWATTVAVALDLFLPSFFPADAGNYGVGSRLAGLATFLTAGVGAVLWLCPSWRSVGVGLLRGSAAVFAFVLVVMPLVVLAGSGLGLM